MQQNYILLIENIRCFGNDIALIKIISSFKAFFILISMLVVVKFKKVVIYNVSSVICYGQ